MLIPLVSVHALFSQLTTSIQKASSQQVPVPEAEEVTCDAVHAAAAKEIHSGLGRGVQGGPPRGASAESPAGPVYAAPGTDDEPLGKDDPTFLHHSTTSKALKFCSHSLFFLLLSRSKKNKKTTTILVQHQTVCLFVFYSNFLHLLKQVLGTVSCHQ